MADPQGPPAGATLLNAPSQGAAGAPAGATLMVAGPEDLKPPEKATPGPPGYAKRLGQSLGVPTSKQDIQPTTIGKLPTIPGSGLSAVAGYGKNLYEKGKEFVEHPGVGTGIRAAMAATPAGGLQQSFAEDVASKNYSGAAGTATGVAAQVLIPEAVERSGVLNVKTPPTAARTITDAINPSAKAMPKFEATLTEHMPKVADFAKRNDIKITSRESLAKAIQGTADELRDSYYKTYIEPVKESPVSTTEIPGYRGAQSDHNFATIGQLDNRLTEINATLRPTYEKGGLAAEAAIDAESKAALDAEAAAIRKQLNSSVGQKLGVDPKTIADARARFGSLRDAADKTQLSANEARYTKNANARGIDLPTSKAGVIHAAARKVFSSNPDKIIAETMERVKPEGSPAPPEHVQPIARSAAEQRAQQIQQQQMQAQQKIASRAKALQDASKKLGPKASVKDLMQEADRAQQ